jgi:hypothetical protein
MKHKGLNQLLCAAVVNDRFRETLLRNPAQAVAVGYFGQSFSLTPEEHDLVVGIQAKKLEDFAAVVQGWISGTATGYDGSGYLSRNSRVLNGVHGRSGIKHNPVASPEPFRDLVRVPVAA